MKYEDVFVVSFMSRNGIGEIRKEKQNQQEEDFAEGSSDDGRQRFGGHEN
ncbi:MAG TPA: hypothetical protein VJ882_01930 [Desulfuromonadales bacterium]|nr:hypothetical protein [Desulfuromonadales bacterium]